jgi:hypothetical protein
MTHLTTLFTQVRTVLRRAWAAIVQLVVQPGRYDLALSVVGTSILVGPLWTTPVTAQVGTSAAEQVLCGEGINTAQWITIGLGLISAFFILKFLLRVMLGLDIIHRTEHIGADGIRRTDATPKQGKKKARGGFYSLAAALLPVFVPPVLAIAGIDVVSCLFP